MADQEPFKLHSQALCALPIVDRFLERMGVEVALGRYLPVADRRVCLPPAVADRRVCLPPAVAIGALGLTT